MRSSLTLGRQPMLISAAAASSWGSAWLSLTQYNYCAGLRIVDQRWINSKIRDLNSLISNQAGSLGMQYVDIYDDPKRARTVR